MNNGIYDSLRKLQVEIDAVTNDNEKADLQSAYDMVYEAVDFIDIKASNILDEINAIQKVLK